MSGETFGGPVEELGRSPSTDARSSVASRPSSMATNALNLKNLTTSSTSLVFASVGPSLLTAFEGYGGRRRAVPLDTGRVRPEPMPLPSCQPVTPPPKPKTLPPLTNPAPSPGLLPVAELARPDWLLFFSAAGRTLALASTQISQPISKCLGHRKAGGEFCESGSAPLLYSDLM